MSSLSHSSVGADRLITAPDLSRSWVGWAIRGHCLGQPCFHLSQQPAPLISSVLVVSSLVPAVKMLCQVVKRGECKALDCCSTELWCCAHLSQAVGQV